MKKLYLYPLWLRIWHWVNAIFFIILIATGISLYYADESEILVSFDLARLLHNISGVAATFLFLIYVIFNIKSKNYKYYIPKGPGLVERMFRQGHYYVYGVFKGEGHPFHPNKADKFNPLQKVTYFVVMFIMFPIVIISGWFMFFPEFAPEEVLGMGGVWPMAISHMVFGFLLSVFMFAHIYLATLGETVFSNFKSMFTGYHYVHEEHVGKTNIDEQIEQGTDKKETLIKEKENDINPPDFKKNDDQDEKEQ
ncbi:MAG: cytochrome b/b6 domain-containing protein [Candidatus Kapaibacterium sp.]